MGSQTRECVSGGGEHSQSARMSSRSFVRLRIIPSPASRRLLFTSAQCTNAARGGGCVDRPCMRPVFTIRMRPADRVMVGDRRCMAKELRPAVSLRKFVRCRTVIVVNYSTTHGPFVASRSCVALRMRRVARRDQAMFFQRRSVHERGEEWFAMQVSASADRRVCVYYLRRRRRLFF